MTDWRHDVWLSRLVAALRRAGYGDRIPLCEVVDEDAILAALDDLVAVAVQARAERAERVGPRIRRVETMLELLLESQGMSAAIPPVVKEDEGR